MGDEVEDHRRACAVGATQWGVPTPCREWDTRALVEHVIGFHEFLVLRPLGVRTHRPRNDPVGRWIATAEAIDSVLETPEALDRSRDYFDGATRAPRTVLPGLTTDVVVHTWDLARAVGTPVPLDPDVWERAWHQATRRPEAHRESGLVGPPVDVASDASVADRLVALLGRDPSWQPPPGHDTRS
jgi:uncharacterized protein (TIGR03086 family)